MTLAAALIAVLLGASAALRIRHALRRRDTLRRHQAVMQFIKKADYKALERVLGRPSAGT